MNEREQVIRARLTAATPGPWRQIIFVGHSGDGFAGGIASPAGTAKDPDIYAGPFSFWSLKSDDNAAFIASAPSDVAWLLAQLDNARVQRSEVKLACDAGMRLDLPAREIVGRIREILSRHSSDKALFENLHV